MLINNNIKIVGILQLDIAYKIQITNSCYSFPIFLIHLGHKPNQSLDIVNQFIWHSLTCVTLCLAVVDFLFYFILFGEEKSYDYTLSFFNEKTLIIMHRL